MEPTGVKTGSSFIGKKMQSIEVQTTHGVQKIPEDYRQKWIILLCHPGDFNLTCLEVFYAFARKYEEFKKLDAELIGFPSDEVICKGKCLGWIKQKLKMNVPFPIITDCLGDIETTQGLFHSIKKIRVVSIIDMEGFMRLRIYYPKFIDLQVGEILQTLKVLRTSKSHNSAMIKI